MVIALVGSVALVLAAYESRPVRLSHGAIHGGNGKPAVVPGPGGEGSSGHGGRHHPAALRLRRVPGAFASLLLGFDNGVGMLVGLAVCTVAYDICGYAAGRRFGGVP